MEKRRNQATNPQNKDFQYVERLAKEMKRTAPFSYDDVEPVEAASDDDLSSLIDIEPGSIGSMSGDTMHTINEIKKRSQEMEARQATKRGPTPRSTYDDLLGIGESFLDLGDEPDDSVTSAETDGMTQAPLDPSELINAIDAVTGLLADDTKENIPVMTSDGKIIEDVVIRNGAVILVTN